MNATASMKPDTRIVAWGSELRTNSLGFRDDKTDVPAKRPGAFRVIVLGDSFTVAAGVDFDRLYTSLLESRWKRKTPGLEVMNLAVGGYNPIQYELVLKEVALELRPDLVLVAVFPFNDLSNDTYRGNFEEAQGVQRTPTRTPWFKKLYVYRAFLVRAESRIRSMVSRPRTPTPADGRAKLDSQRVARQDAQENLEALERTMTLAASNGIPAAIALLPNTDTYDLQRPDFAPFETLCQQHRWTCINLLDDFAANEVPPKSLRLNVIDGHPNNQYHELVADTLDKWMWPVVESAQRPVAEVHASGGGL